MAILRQLVIVKSRIIKRSKWPNTLYCNLLWLSFFFPSLIGRRTRSFFSRSRSRFRRITKWNSPYSRELVSIFTTTFLLVRSTCSPFNRTVEEVQYLALRKYYSASYTKTAVTFWQCYVLTSSTVYSSLRNFYLFIRRCSLKDTLMLSRYLHRVDHFTGIDPFFPDTKYSLGSISTSY